MSKKCQDFIGSVRLSGNSWKQKIDNNFIYIFYVHFTKEFSKSAAVKPRIQWIYFFLALICIFMTFEMCSLLLRKCSIYDGIKFDKKCEKKRKWKKKVKRKHSSTFSLFSKWVSVTSVTLWGQIILENVHDENYVDWELRGPCRANLHYLLKKDCKNHKKKPYVCCG